jgi:hypothetical protein
VREQWWKVEIGRERLIHRLQKDFVLAFLSRGAPRGAALFCGAAGGRKLSLFFSPDAAAIAGSILHEHGGCPCDPPPRAFLLAGHEEDRALLAQATRQ